MPLVPDEKVNYGPHFRDPVLGKYRGYGIHSSPSGSWGWPDSVIITADPNSENGIIYDNGSIYYLNLDYFYYHDDEPNYPTSYKSIDFQFGDSTRIGWSSGQSGSPTSTFYTSFTGYKYQ